MENDFALGVGWEKVIWGRGFLLEEEFEFARMTMNALYKEGHLNFVIIW